MSQDNLVQPGARISKSLWEEFRNDIIDRRGSARGHMRTELENALREYIDASKGGDINDRLRRIENKLESIDENTDTLSDDGQRKNKKDSDVGSRTEKRINKIESLIDRERGDSPVVHGAVVRQAIEEVAGHSDPTIRRYKQMLTDREVLYQHPKHESRYFCDPEEFTKMVDTLRDSGGIGQSRYEQIVNEYGNDWWDQYSPIEEPERGVQ